MSILKARIVSLDGVKWIEHVVDGDYDDEYEYDLDETLEGCIINGEIEVGDLVNIEGNEESPYDLDDNEYVITFNKQFADGRNFYHEDIFSYDECLDIFGNDFVYEIQR